MPTRAGSVPERLRASLFFVPLVFVVAGGLAGVVMIAVDRAVGDDVTDLPLVLATFTYCLVVLRVVRDATEAAEAIVPNLSVSLAVVAGVVAVLAVVAFIDHNAHAMEVSEILGRVTAETTRSIETSWVGTPGSVQDTRPTTAPEQPGLRIPLRESGWIQRIDHDALRELVPGGARSGSRSPPAATPSPARRCARCGRRPPTPTRQLGARLMPYRWAPPAPWSRTPATASAKFG